MKKQCVNRIFCNASTAALIALICMTACRSSEVKPVQEMLNGVTPANTVTVCELDRMMKACNSLPQSVNIEGVITKVFICPPCPANADCEYCPPDYIVIEESGCSVKIHVNRNNQFVENKRYSISLKYWILSDNTSGFIPYHIYSAVNK